MLYYNKKNIRYFSKYFIQHSFFSVVTIYFYCLKNQNVINYPSLIKLFTKKT